MVQRRKRIKHERTFEERLKEEAIRFREAANEQPLGSHARDLLLRRARQAETASHMNRWLSSPGLQPPKALEGLLGDQKSSSLATWFSAKAWSTMAKDQAAQDVTCLC